MLKLLESNSKQMNEYVSSSGERNEGKGLGVSWNTDYHELIITECHPSKIRWKSCHLQL